MKVNELMIGDWVLPNICNTYNEPSKIVGIQYNSYRGNNYVDWVDCEVCDELDLDDIKPILLTSEILEKNGFINKDNEWVHYCDFPFIDFTLNKDSSGFYINYVPNGYINYVHELQHAFKLFKVNGEIII